MFKKIKKTGIYWGLFIAVFGMKNDTINAASFTYIPKQRSVIETNNLMAPMSASYQMPPVLFYDPYQMPRPGYRLLPSVCDSGTSGHQSLGPVYDPYQILPPGYRPSPSVRDPRMSSYQPLVPIYNQMLQNVIRCVFTGKTWEVENNKTLDINTIHEYLYTLKHDVLRELGRLLIAQNFAKYNCPENNLLTYIAKKNEDPHANQISMDEYQDALVNTREIKYLSNFMVESGRLGKICSYMRDDSRIKGIFNLDKDIKQQVMNVKDDKISEKKSKKITFNVARNILEYLFSENIKLKHIGRLRSNNTFELDIIYKGFPIPGLEKPQHGRNFYLSKGSVRCGNTNGVRIVVALSNKNFPPYIDGLIRFADLYILELSD